MVQLPRNLRYRLQRSDTAGPVLLAVLVGVLAAAWAIAFRWLIRRAQWVFLEQDGLLAALFPGDGVWSDVQILVAPAIGRLFVPQGKTRVRVGDVLVLMTTSEHESELESWILEGSAGR